MRSGGLALSLWVAMAPGGPARADEAACPAPEPRSVLRETLRADFVGAATLDRRFVPSFGLHGSLDQELQVFLPDQAMLVPEAGLRLRAAQRQAYGRDYVSGQVTTSGTFAQRYGHFEMLARMPQANGMWPAFWLVPENDVWPPEIDVVEYIYAPSGIRPDPAQSRYSIPATTLHWRAEDGALKQIAPGFGSPASPFQTGDDWNRTPAPAGAPPGLAGYHRYAVDWRPGRINWLIDDKPVFCVRDDPPRHRVPDIPLYMLLDLALSAGSPAKHDWTGYVEPGQSFPQDFDIASVEVDQFADLPPAPPPPLTVRELGAAPAMARRGESVTLHARLQVGDADLGASTGMAIGIRRFDSLQYTGIGSYAIYVPQQIARLQAGRSYEIAAPVTIPVGLTPGLYSVSFETGYAAGPPNGPNNRRSAALQQGGVLQIIDH